MAETAEKSDDVAVTRGGKECLESATDLMDKCFRDDPTLRFMMSNMTDQAREKYFRAYMRSILKSAALNDAIFEEAGGWKCGTVWMPPGKRVDNYLTMLQSGILVAIYRIGLAGLKRMLVDFVAQSDAAKRKYLRDAAGNKVTRYHYLFFIGTDPSARGQGLASKLIRRWQEQATKDRMPIWLEATTKNSRNLYERLGFTEVQVMSMGQGTHGANGAREPGGPGINQWAMIWWPEGVKL